MSKPVFEDLFTFEGRRNRLSYNLFNLSLVALWGGIYLLTLTPLFHLSGAAAIALLLVIPLGIATAIASIAVGAQRCRDIGWPGVIVLIGGPIVYPLAFLEGTAGDNDYGPDPTGGWDEPYDPDRNY